MRIKHVSKLKSMIHKMKWFGCFDITVICFDNQSHYHAITSLHGVRLQDYAFTNRFKHFMQLIPVGQTRICVQKESLWVCDTPLSQHRLVFIKKEQNEMTLFIFHADVRESIIRLMLHQEAVKRVALYVQENCVLKSESISKQHLGDLFSLHDVSGGNSQHGHRYHMMEAILASHLTKKENRYVHAYWLHRSVQTIAQSTGLSRSYINNILLSSAHKLGLSRVQDLLSLHSTHSILLQRDNCHETRCHRYQRLEETA